MGQDADNISADMVLETLKKRPRLLFDVLRKGNKILVAGPWVGPTTVTRTGQPFHGHTLEITVTEFRREGPVGETVALVIKEEDREILAQVPLPGERRPSKAVPVVWYACPREVDAFDPSDRRKGSFHENGNEDSVQIAQSRADMALVDHGYQIVDGFGLEAGPWVEKKNHQCRDILTGSMRPGGASPKIAIVRKLDTLNNMWSWAILDVEDPDKALKWGKEHSLIRAKMAADKALEDKGWRLHE